MANEVFLSAVKKLAEQNLTVLELIEIVEPIKASGDADLVMQAYRLWIKANQENPQLFIANFNYAIALSDAGHLAEAKEVLEATIAKNPDFSPAYINLGTVLERMGLLQEAVMQWSALANRLGSVTQDAIKYKTMALNQVGRVLEMGRMPVEAESVLRQSLELNQNQTYVMHHYTALRMRQCEWPIISPWEGVEKKSLMTGISPLSVSVYTDDPMFHLASAWNYSKNYIGYASSDFQDECLAAKTNPRPGRRRIGYVSSDLRAHAVGFIMAELFELHNREEFEIYIYYNGIAADDPLKTRIKAAAEHWVDIAGLDDSAAARRIIADEIDLLVDLNGYTAGERTKMFAMRPAPIIVNWLGYPGSAGSPYHQYIIADDWIIPKDHEIYYSEKVMRLPCYQPNDRRRVSSPNQPSRQDAGLPEGAMVYCCFNGPQKITRFTFERWMTILKEVPDSVLWLLSGSELTNKNLMDHAEKCGVARERIIIAQTIASPDHLARYSLADLFLDTSPYGAHVTASDSLWTGVPILTLSGRGFASRVCGSLVRAAGLPEMVCSTAEEYVERAVAFGRDREKLLPLKQKLKDNRDSCVLFDSELCARSLEDVYEQMWQEFCRGQTPRPDLTNLDVYFEMGCEENHESVEVLTIKDYRAWYQTRLAKRHKYCAIGADQRLWTHDDIAKVERVGPCETIDIHDRKKIRYS